MCKALLQRAHTAEQSLALVVLYGSQPAGFAHVTDQTKWLANEVYVRNRGFPNRIFRACREDGSDWAFNKENYEKVPMALKRPKESILVYVKAGSRQGQRQPWLSWTDQKDIAYYWYNKARSERGETGSKTERAPTLGIKRWRYSTSEAGKYSNLISGNT